MAGNVDTLRGHTPTEFLHVGGIIVSHIRHDTSGIQVVAGEIEETFTHLSPYLTRRIGKEVLCTIRSSRRHIRLGVAPITEDNRQKLEQSEHFPLLAQTIACMQEQTSQTSEGLPNGSRRGIAQNSRSPLPEPIAVTKQKQLTTYIEEKLPMLLRRAQRFTLSETEAEDLVQDALLKAYIHLDQFEEGTNINSWIMQILRNTGLDKIKANKLRQTVPLPDREEEVNMHLLWDNSMFEPGVEETVWQGPHSTSLEMDEALSFVSRDRRDVLFALYVDDLSQAEASQLLHIPVGTIMSRSARGRHDLAAALPSKLIPK